MLTSVSADPWVVTRHPRAGGQPVVLVVVAALEEIDAVGSDQVDQTVFLSDPTRPYARPEVLQLPLGPTKALSR